MSARISVTANGLSSETTYYFHFVQETSGGDSNVESTNSFTTDAGTSVTTPSSRDLTTDFANETVAYAVTPVFFVELVFDDETVRMWSGTGPINWDGQTWGGAGDLLGIDAMPETTSIRAEGTTISLAGVDPANIAIALSKDFQGRTANVWLGFLDDDFNVIVSPYKVFSGRMDQMPIYDQGDKATVNVQAESHLIDLTKARTVRYTDEAQKELYPGDRGLEFVEAIQEKPITWGQSSDDN